MAKAEAERRKVTIDKAEALMKAYADREFKVVKERTAEPVKTAKLDVLKAEESDDSSKCEKIYRKEA